MGLAETAPRAADRRRAELGLVLTAAVITVGAYVLASLGQNAQIPARIIPFGVALLSLLVLTHVVVRLFAPGADSTVLPLAILLNGLGYVMIARLSDNLASLQTVWTFVAVLGFVAVLLFVERPGDLAHMKYTFLAVGMGLLLLPLVPGLGTSVGGARIWVSFGPVNFQPGEFAKLSFALFFAGYLSDTGTARVESTQQTPAVSADADEPGPRVLVREAQPWRVVIAAWAFAVLVMVAEKDLGSALLFFTLFTVMMWMATGRTWLLALGFGGFAVAAVVAYQLFGVVQTRVSVWLDPWSQYEGKGYQIVQAMFSFANGGTGGTGLGMGSPTKIPAAKTDYIFAALAEETGLLGATAVLVAFLLVMGAGLRIAMRTDRAFEKLLAIGLTTIVGIQSFIIIGGVIRLIPLTGITLPFVSYGGSSLLANWVLLALLIRISDRTARREGESPDVLSIGERMARRSVRREAARRERVAGGAR